MVKKRRGGRGKFQKRRTKARGVKGPSCLRSGEMAGVARVSWGQYHEYHVGDRAVGGWGAIYWDQIMEGLECQA